MAASTRITSLPRELSAAERQLIEAGNHFGLRLFSEVEGATRSTHPNLFMSPLSVSMALGMLYGGAAGETMEVMSRTIGFDGLTPDAVNRSYRSLIQMLRELDPGVHFLLGNSVWCRQGITLTPSFLDSSRLYFDARVEALDFSNPAAAVRINDWVKQATAGRIVSIVDSPIPIDVWLCLLNAIWFRAPGPPPSAPRSPAPHVSSVLTGRALRRR